MESSSHHRIFFSVPPFDQYRLLMEKYRNSVMIRRVPFPIWANCPPSKKACSTGSFVCVRNAMARSAPMEEATINARRFTFFSCKKSSTCRISSALLTYFCPAQQTVEVGKMQKYRSCKYLAIGSLLDPVTPIA